MSATSVRKLDHCPFDVDVATVQGIYVVESPLDGKPYASITALDGLTRVYLNAAEPAAFVAALRAAADTIEDRLTVSSEPDDMPTTTTQDVKRLLALKAAKDDHETALKPITAEIEALTERILDRWSEEGTSSQRVNGRLVSVSRRAWARVLDRDRLVPALQAAGLDHLLTANTQTLSAILKEWEEHDQEIPAPLVGVIDRFERFSLSVRNGRS